MERGRRSDDRRPIFLDRSRWPVGEIPTGRCSLAVASHNMLYLWSDAWLLQAIALAAKSGRATLSEVMASADAVNHALPTDDELHGGFSRLTTGGFIEEVDECFRLTNLVPPETLSRIITRGWKVGRQAAEELLDAESWTSEANVADPRNRLVYPGLTVDRIRRAEREYRRQMRRNR